MTLNWVDLVILAVVLYHVRDGWERGFTYLLANLSSFLISLWLAVRFHAVVGNFFVEKFGISASWTNVLGYVGVAIISQVVIEELLLLGLSKLPDKYHRSKVNHAAGAVLSVLNACVLVSFFLLLTLALPLRGTVKDDIRKSVIGRSLVILSERYGGSVKSSLEDAAREAVRFLTVKPGSKERIPIEVPTTAAFRVDAASEAQMVALVNAEREKRGLNTLTVDPTLTKVGREKSMDMFERRYFSHYDPDGNNAADRMNQAGASYTVVGENLAYAPDVTSAHEGLMNSEGHRANILESRYGRIGIGVIDGGIYGKMFTQIFAD